MNVRTIAKHMAAELESSRLEVVLQEDADGRRRRVAISSTPTWYQRFCAAYSNVRRGYRRMKTYIKRRETLNALWRIARGKPAGVYGERLRSVMRAVAADWAAEGERR